MVQELRSEGIAIKDFFGKRALAQENRAVDLETEVTMHHNIIIEARI
jgi:hypothetical protein